MKAQEQAKHEHEQRSAMTNAVNSNVSIESSNLKNKKFRVSNVGESSSVSNNNKIASNR